MSAIAIGSNSVCLGLDDGVLVRDVRKRIGICRSMSNADPGGADLWVVYDGECPFCSSYVQLYRIRDRTPGASDRCAPLHPLVAEIKRAASISMRAWPCDFNDRLYHGAEAMNLLAVLGSGDRSSTSPIAPVSAHATGAAALSDPGQGPLLILRLLGRRLIGDA